MNRIRAAGVILALVLLSAVPAAHGTVQSSDQDPAHLVTSGSSPIVASVALPALMAPSLGPHWMQSHSELAGGNLSVGIRASENTTEEGVSVNFQSIVVGSGPWTYVWNFGDNDTSSVAEPSHVYQVAGNLTVALHVFGANGSWGASTLPLSVALKLNLIPPVFPPSGKLGNAITFVGTAISGVPPYAYFWNFGDHNASHVQGPLHTYARPGTYPATLTLNDSAGGQYLFSELVLVEYPNASQGTRQGNSSSTPSPTLWYIGGGLVVVVAIAALVILSRRK